MKKYYVFATIGLLGSALSLSFANCSKVTFARDDASIIDKLNTGGGIVINADAEFTKSEQVQLSLIHGSAAEMYITNDPTCKSGGSWESYVAEKPWVLADKNKSAKVHVKFREVKDSDLESNCFSDAIVHDDIPPVVDIKKSVDPAIGITNAAVEFSASDAGSGVEIVMCEKDGSNQPCSGQMKMSNLVEGHHNAKIHAKDKAGNESTPSSIVFLVDLTPPTVQLISTPALVTSGTSSSFQFQGSDNLSGIKGYECKIDSEAQFVPCSSPYTQNLSSGVHTFHVQAIDKVGNRSKEEKYQWTIDMTAPHLEFTKTPPAKSNSATAEFQFVGTDDGQAISNFRCSLDDAAYAPCTSPHVLNGLTEQPHKFSVIGIDSAGNPSQPIVYNWLVDLTKPKVQITTKPAPVTKLSDATLGFTATDVNGSGIAKIECSLDNGAFEVCEVKKDYTNLSESTHKFSVRATDQAGNVSDTVSYSWRVDKTPPTLEILSGPAALTKLSAADFVMKADDPNGGEVDRIECKLDSEPNFSICSSPKTYSAILEGSHLFSARAVDKAGNESKIATHSWVMDASGPAINFQKFPLSVIGQLDKAELQFTVTDSYSDVASVSCGLNGSLVPCPASHAVNYSNLSVGDYTYTVTASDKLGNQSRVDIKFAVRRNLIEKNQIVPVDANNKIDVLVVIDNSGSMATEQANMSTRFATFLDQLNGLNWQVGIVTTDLSGTTALKDGRLVPMSGLSGQYILNSSMDFNTAKTAFGATIKRSESGSGNEQGIGASYRAIQRSLIPGEAVNAPNVAFFRQDAALAIVVVSDADETNPNGLQTQNKPEGLIDLVKTTWNNQKSFAFHSIVVKSGDSVCLPKNGNEAYGKNYETLSNLTGGVIGSVCADDYASQLSAMGRVSASLVNSVNLECAPVDVNSDGKIDVAVALSGGGAVPSYVVDGTKVTFAQALPAGQVNLQYSCLSN